MSERFIAVDWGTTNRRVFVIQNGTIVATERDDRGAATVTDFPAEIAAIGAKFGGAPMLLAGMVGSNIGWQAVPYVPAPAGLETLAEALVLAGPGVWIVPGVSYRSDERADVMRGEEVQLLGAARAGLVPDDAVLCQPGTHCKWATLAAGRIDRFTTAMTGELFALLRRDSLLATQLDHPVFAGTAFRAGVRKGASHDLAADLFAVRAAGLLGTRQDEDAAAYVSGLLIGADVAARLTETGRLTVHILADPELGGLYRATIEELGGSAVVVDSHAAFVAGISRIQELAK